MLTSDKERAICRRYSAADDTGHVHCSECPLRKGEGGYDFRCKAWCHYDRHTCEWVRDETSDKKND